MNKYAVAFTEAMKQAGISSNKVAAVAGVGQNNVAHWRAGRRPIPAEHAPVIGALLSVPPERISKAYDQGLRVESVRQSAAEYLFSGTTREGHVLLDRLQNFGRSDGLDRIWLPEFLARRELGLTAIEHVRWAVQMTRIMEPEIRRNALVLLDIGISEREHVMDGGTYAYTLWGHSDIRKISIRRDGWSLFCNSSETEQVLVPEADLPELRILGAVIGWL